MTCQTVVGVWHRGGGGMRWVRESSWDARLEHGAPSGTAPQFSPKFSRLCFHPSLTQNTELPGWQSRVCFPPPRAECWTWYAIPTGAAFDNAKRVTLLRFWIWRRICPVISLCHVIQQTCPGSKSCHIDLNSTQQKKPRKGSFDGRNIQRRMIHWLIVWCLSDVLYVTERRWKVILLQSVLELASSEHLFRWFCFTLREWGPRSSRSTQHASLSASPKDLLRISIYKHRI